LRRPSIKRKQLWDVRLHLSNRLGMLCRPVQLYCEYTEWHHLLSARPNTRDLLER